MSKKTLRKAMLLKTSRLANSESESGRETRGPKMKASSIMSLKTHIEKMSDLRISTILLKTHQLTVFSPL
jgi:hypothetical protein